MELETRYGEALGSISRVTVAGAALELLASDLVAVLARRRR